MSKVAHVHLDWEAMFCDRHLRRLIAPDDWPVGAPSAILSMFDVAAADRRVIELAGGYGKADMQRLNSIFVEYGPMCCYVGPEAFLLVEHFFVERMGVQR